MARVLVTGGTGFLGTQLVDRLTKRGHEVRALSRRAPAEPHLNVTYLRGNVLTGEGIENAVEDTDAVIHAASSFRRRARETEIRGTENTLAAARRAGAHLVYVSIVGVDRNRFPYYKSKLAAEAVVESRGSGWTIQRATQFHDLMEVFLSLPVFPATTHMAFQPVDTADVSDRLADLIEAGPSGRVEDFGGPQVMPVAQIEAVRRRVTGRRGRLLRMPAVGFFGDFDRGSNLCPGRAAGRITWEEWLTARSRS